VAKIEAGDLPSVAIAVYGEGDMIWEEAIGWANVEARVPATLDSVYGLGSLAKSITATAMMVLVEQGRVDLDAPADSYLGAQKLTVCAGGDREITVRDLLACTAGIPHGWYGYVLDDEPAFVRGDEYLRRFGLAVFSPGERFLYSNHSYGIAREIIARVSGTSYEEFLRAELFEPLGMRSSGVSIAATSDAVAAGYVEEAALAKGYVTGPIGGAALFSSAADLLRYARFHLGRPLPDQRAILGPASLAAMHRLSEGAPAGSFMALGWGVLELGEIGKVLISNGSVAGANATLLLLPARDIAIVCLANRAFAPSISDATAFTVADVLAPGFMQQIERAAAEHEQRSAGEYAVREELLGPWKGEITTSEGSLPLRLDFQRDGDIHVRVGDALPVLLDGAHLETGLIVGSSMGSLPATERTEGGNLTFHLASRQHRITGDVVWITNRIDRSGTAFPLVIPGCITLTRPESEDPDPD
jgi:CubicO group peptidase (beta-lactamase class C family)